MPNWTELLKHINQRKLGYFVNPLLKEARISAHNIILDRLPQNKICIY